MYRQINLINTKKLIRIMNIFKIREIIAESGRLKVKEVLEYFESLHPQADPKIVEEQAKEMIKEAKKYI